MLQQIRDKTQGWFTKILMGLLIAVFALWGVDTLVGNIVNNQPKLTVNGDEIPVTEIDRLTQRKTQEMIAQMGKDPDLSQLNEALFRESAVNELIQRKLIEQSANENGMAVSQVSIDRRIASNPDFQVNGKYDSKQAAVAIQSAGYTPAGYRALLAQEVRLNQQLAAYTATGIATTEQLNRLAKLVHQKRSVKYLVVEAARFMDSVTVSDQDIQSYYQSHQSNFQQEEQVSFEYIELDKNKMMEAVTVSDQQLQAAYNEEVANYKAQTERRASHILLPATTEAELATARKTAQEIKAKLDAGGDFAKLAEQYSQDTDSAKKGGDVGFTTGNSFVENFENALKALSLNQVSDPVQTEFGIHLIKLTEVKETKVEPFEARKNVLLTDLKKKAADEEFKKKVDELKTLAFESPDLNEPAAKLQLTKQTMGLFSRNSGTGVAESEAVKAAAFSNEVKEQGLNSEVISVNSDHSIVLHVLEHQPAQIRPLDLVKGEVEGLLRQQKATEQARLMGESFVAGSRTGDNIDGLLSAQKLVWETLENIERSEARLNPEISDRLFAMPRPTEGKPSVLGFTLGTGDYAVVQLLAVTEGNPADLKEGELQNMRNFISQQGGAHDLTAFVKSLEARARIKGKETQLAVQDPLL